MDMRRSPQKWLKNKHTIPIGTILKTKGTILAVALWGDVT